MSQSPYVIGFANLSEDSEYAVVVRQGLEKAIAQRDNIQLINRDNKLDDKSAFDNASDFAKQNVDLAIFFHINERIGMEIQTMLRPIPVLTIDIPFPLAPHFGINNQQSGEILGKALTDWIQANWDGQVDRILALVDSRVIVLRDRTEYAVDHLKTALGLDRDSVFYLDCGNDRDTTIKNVSSVFDTWEAHERIGVITFNAESTFGLLESAKAHNILDKLAIVANAADHPLLDKLQEPDNHIIATSYFDPADYGEHLMALVDRHREGERLPQRTFMDMELHLAPHPFVT